MIYEKYSSIFRVKQKRNLICLVEQMRNDYINVEQHSKTFHTDRTELSTQDKLEVPFKGEWIKTSR